MILLPLEKGAGGILKQTAFNTQVTFGNENFMLGFYYCFTLPPGVYYT